MNQPDYSELVSLISVYCSIFAAASVVAAVSYGFFRVIGDMLNRKAKRIETEQHAFEEVVKRLSSPLPAEQLSAAILLRRFYRTIAIDQRRETTNVISSLLRTLPTGVLQKTLGDGLAYSVDLSCADLQNTNLQGIYLGNKEKTLQLRQADFFRADLAYALLEHLEAQDVIFYHANLSHAQMKQCHMEKAVFRGAHLGGASFKEVYLDGADFSGATDVPELIQKNLRDGIYVGKEPVTAVFKSSGKSVFFSMPGCMSREEQLLVLEFKRLLESKHHTVIYYTRDCYPHFGQFNKIKQGMMESCAMIAFGFKQTHIRLGEHRPGSSEAAPLADVWLPTSWNDVEVGMGLMCGLPILLVKDEDVRTGIFDEHLSEYFIATVPAGIAVSAVEKNEGVGRWLAAFERPTSAAGAVTPEKPVPGAPSA